ncbi:hypothetical protein ACVWWG_000381 [Bradyrhizobium sp. LB7.2]
MLACQVEALSSDATPRAAFEDGRLQHGRKVASITSGHASDPISLICRVTPSRVIRSTFKKAKFQPFTFLPLSNPPAMRSAWKLCRANRRGDWRHRNKLKRTLDRAPPHGVPARFPSPPHRTDQSPTHYDETALAPHCKTPCIRRCTITMQTSVKHVPHRKFMRQCIQIGLLQLVMTWQPLHHRSATTSKGDQDARDDHFYSPDRTV